MNLKKIPIRLERTEIYKSRWVNLYRDRVELANGNILDQYHILDFGRGSVVMVVENEQGQILMELIPRYPTGKISWEFPAGGIEGDESILDAAKREIFEETGYETHAHEEIYMYHPLNGIATTHTYVIHCKAGNQTGKVDSNEVAEICWFDVEAVQAMIQRGEITDAFSLIGLFIFLNQKSPKIRSQRP